jgi:hypothetical protein
MGLTAARIHNAIAACAGHHHYFTFASFAMHDCSDWGVLGPARGDEQPFMELLWL